MKKNYKIVTSIWFIIGLTLLLVNDFILKGLYGNYLTGKLSDFAGLFIFPLFWTALLPKYKTAIFWAVGLMFIFWKSSYSQSWIELWNSLGILTIYRTVDYSDLVALIVLPLAYKLDNKKEQIKILNINPLLPLCVAIFAFMATSYRTDIVVNKTYLFDFSKKTLVNRFDKIDSLNSNYGVKFTKNNPDTVEFSIPSSFCFDRFDAKISVKENENKTTNLTLISVQHHCPEGKKDKERLLTEFEKRIIDKLNDSQKLH